MNSSTPNSGPDLDALFATARAHRPDTSRLEYAFETRLMARLSEERSSSVLTWAWRLCPYFALLALGAAYWSHSSTGQLSEDGPILAGNNSPEQVLVSYMTGGDTFTR